MTQVLYLENIIPIQQLKQQQFMIDLMWAYKKCNTYAEFGKATEELLIQLGKIEK